MFRECQTLRVEVVMHKAEGTGGEEIRGCIDVASLFGSYRECCVREAVGGDVGDGGGEDGCFGGREGTGWGWVVGRMILADDRERNWFGEGLQPGKEGLCGH